MRRILFLLCTTLVSLCLHAQSDEEQVLVFRHSGEVNLFYASRLDSITLSAYDADSTLHDKVVSQVFHSQDTTMVVPISEIDSVAFGSRNAIEMRPNVKDMTAETDLPWILRFDGEAIYYRLNTPASVLPKVGQRLFYGLDGDDSEDAIFPYGLTAKATAVTTLADEIRVDIETVELNEIFSKFFYAGNISQQKEVNVKQRRAYGETNIGTNIPLPDIGYIDIRGKFSLDGPVTLNPLANYVFLDMAADFTINVDVNVEAEENREENYESFHGHYNTVATFWRVLNVGVAAGAFVDLNASMTLAMGLERNYHRRVIYRQQHGEQTLEFPEVPEEIQTTDNAKIDLTLDGSVYFGPIAAIQISTVGELLGARVKMKVGPQFEGKVSIGMLRELHDYNPTLYGSASLEACNRITLEGSIINRHYLVWGEVDEHNIANTVLEVNKHTIELFPEFQQTRGVEATTQTETAVTVATHVENEIMRELETGFELLDADENILDSVYVEDLIESDITDIQGFEASFTLPKRTTPDTNPLRVRPVFHYAGYPIAYQDVPVMHDSHIMPITSYGTNGVATFISGASVVGTAKANSTVHHIGNYLPVPVYDPAFPPVWYEPKTPGKHLDKDTEKSLFGTWKGEIDGGIVELTFKNDGTGTYRIDGDTQTFNYDLNNPQSGDVRLLLNDQTTLIFTVISVSDTTLILRKKGKTEQYTLNKQY